MKSYHLAEKIFHMQRSVSSVANDQTLEMLKEYCNGGLNLKSFSRKQYGNWKTPKKWDLKRAEILDENDNIIISSRDNTLHVVAHSQSVDAVISSEELLENHIYTDVNNPSRLPYVTSYYEESWGFCVPHKSLAELQIHEYLRVVIEADFHNEGVSYGECFIPGTTDKEILISSYVCHPGMANNETSGMVVICDLINYFNAQEAPLPFGLRFLIWPETFGAIAFLHERYAEIKATNIGCLVVSCVGDGRALSLVQDKNNSYISLVSEAILSIESASSGLPFKKFDFSQRGSDERQFCSPQLDLDCATICNSKFGEYPEYHSSEDNLEIISQLALDRSTEAIKKIIQFLALKKFPMLKTIGEPKLSEFGIYPHRRNLSSQEDVMKVLNFCAYCDGRHNAIEIANLSNLSLDEYAYLYNLLREHGVVE